MLASNLDYRHNAEAAKAALDGLQRKGRILRVRFATHGAALRVKNLHPFVSNELLEQAFSQFGELERAIVIVDDRGKPTGEGLVEFVRKPGAQQALRRINDGVFLIGSNPKPIEVEPLEQKDEEDGMPEKFLPHNEQYKKEREKAPRFAPHSSFEYDFGMRWKQLAEMERKGIEQVKKEMDENRIKLEDDMQNALYEYQAEQIRQDLLRQQEELRRLEELRNQDRMRRAQELEMRRQEEERVRQAEDRRRQEMMMRQQEMARRAVVVQEEPVRRLLCAVAGEVLPQCSHPQPLPRASALSVEDQQARLAWLGCKVVVRQAELEAQVLADSPAWEVAAVEPVQQTLGQGWEAVLA
nr:hypothetical protein BaRGS_020567 [Batillaria attramentaria]